MFDEHRPVGGGGEARGPDLKGGEEAESCFATGQFDVPVDPFFSERKRGALDEEAFPSDGRGVRSSVFPDSAVGEEGCGERDWVRMCSVGSGVRGGGALDIDDDFPATRVLDLPSACEELPEREGDGDAGCLDGFQPRVSIVLEKDAGCEEACSFSLDGMRDGGVELELL